MTSAVSLIIDLGLETLAILVFCGSRRAQNKLVWFTIIVVVVISVNSIYSTELARYPESYQNS